MLPTKAAWPRLSILAAAIAATLLATGAQATPDPAILTTNDFGFDPHFSSHDTLGFAFTAKAPIFIDQLGIFDDAQDGLADSHLLGLWDASGNLLASTTIAAGTGAPLIDLHRYAAITPVALTVGAQYYFGAFHVDFADLPAALSYAPKTDSRIDLGFAGISNNGMFSAPNFIIPNIDYANFTIRNTVPEPASWAMMLFGLVGTGMTMRLRRPAPMAA